MKRLFTNLTPLIPLSFLRRGGREERGADAPLRRPVKLVSFKREGGQGDGLINNLRN